MRLTANATSRTALAGLAVVLMLLGVVGVGSALRTREVTRRSHEAGELAEAYQRARVLVGRQERIELEYRVQPSPWLRALHTAVATEFWATTRAIAAIGSERDRALARELDALQHAYVAATGRLIAAIDAGEHEKARRIGRTEIGPRFKAMASVVDRATQEHRDAAAGALRRMRESQRSIMTATLVAFAVGLALLSFFMVRLARMNRQLARHACESEHSALHDALTGLPNRVLLSDRIEQLIARSDRDPAPFALMMLDLDRFKEINDTLGHSSGDKLLRQIAPRLRALLRPTDTLARLGGDEFALLLPTASTAEAREIAGRVLAALREPFTLGEMSVAIDASIGIVVHPAHGGSAETLVKRADVAMYVAKGAGSGHALYDPASDPHDAARLQLVDDLRRALADGDQLELHFQPKFTATDLRITGVEALVRWNHPLRGRLMPGEFVPVAERTGLIRPLTLIVLEKAARQAAAWRDDGFDLRVAVNLSVANLLDGGLVDDVERILAAAGLPPEQLELELTETTIMTDPARAKAMLSQLAAMGVRLSIDDYGTGHSSLAYLRRLPVHKLKIDRSFVQRLASEPDDLHIVRSTIELGHHLGLLVIAEGVEDAESLELLRRHGCDLVQGYHVGRPVPAEALAGRLRRAQPERGPSPARPHLLPAGRAVLS